MIQEGMLDLGLLFHLATFGYFELICVMICLMHSFDHSLSWQTCLLIQGVRIPTRGVVCYVFIFYIDFETIETSLFECQNDLTKPLGPINESMACSLGCFDGIKNPHNK